MAIACSRLLRHYVYFIRVKSVTYWTDTFSHFFFTLVKRQTGRDNRLACYTEDDIVSDWLCHDGIADLLLLVMKARFIWLHLRTNNNPCHLQVPILMTRATINHNFAL